jgi:hypothetical protein
MFLGGTPSLFLRQNSSTTMKMNLLLEVSGFLLRDVDDEVRLVTSGKESLTRSIQCFRYQHKASYILADQSQLPPPETSNI